MRVAFVSSSLPQQPRAPGATVASYYHVLPLAKELAKLGATVDILQASRTETQDLVDGFRVHGVRTYRKALIGRDAHAALDRIDPAVVHFFGPMLWRAHRTAAFWAQRNNRIMSFSDHGGSPETRFWRVWGQRRVLRGAKTFFFPSQMRLDQWREAPVWPATAQAFCVPEAATEFRLLAQQDLRKDLQIKGSPTIFWSGNLTHLKAPLTGLDAFRSVLRQEPRAHMYMAYRFTDQLEEVKARLQNDPILGGAVTLLGELPREKMEYYYNCADIYFSPTLREIGSISTAEALACGAVPVMTDLPSLRLLSADGRVGALVSEHTADAFSQAILHSWRNITPQTRQQMRDFYDAMISYEMIARAHLNAWQQAADRAPN